jgi:superfamily II DNA or RNA helicase
VYLPLRDLDSVPPVYTVPEDDLLGEVIIPGLSAAVSARCMMGFFDSSALKHVGPGLAAFLSSGPSASLRLIASPRLSPEDLKAVEDSVARRAELLEQTAGEFLEGALISPQALARFSRRCLAYLLACGKLDLRFAAVRAGMFHPKVWVLADKNDTLVIHGSSNFTSPGLLYNYEAITIEKSWCGGDAAARVEKFSKLFDRLWSGQDPNAVVVDIPRAIRTKLLSEGRQEAPPSLEDFFRAWREDHEAGLAPEPPTQSMPLQPVPSGRLQVPPGLSISEGRFRHQGAAVQAWEEARGVGILAMATGSGKTISALVAATRLAEREQRLLVVIAVPYRPLVEQWAAEAKRFGAKPIVFAGASPAQRGVLWQEVMLGLRHGVASAHVCVVTHDYLVSEEFAQVLCRVPDGVSSLIIADEVHNLGRPSFLSRPPNTFKFRLGLSATPDRQYDPIGTQALYDYFGQKVFEFSLAEAIGTCLVPYDYFIQKVSLTLEEVAEWERLTEELRRAGFGSDVDAEDSGKMPTKIVKLLVRRRAILEAAENKLTSLEEAILATEPSLIKHTLIYATDKSPAQLEAVNEMLRRHRILFHQVTQAESGDRRLLSDVLSRFASGEIQVLTAKRVLDEGVDIPETCRAFLLASSTVRRQWIQRRGRVLRTCERIGKRKAKIIDFLTTPPGGDATSARGIVRQEISRAQEFARLADNAGDPGGPYDVIKELLG